MILQSEVILLVLLKVLTSNASLCETHVKYIEESHKQGAVWARRIKDAWGKFPSGVYSGNYFDFGNFDQCVNFHHVSQARSDIFGQYCLIFADYELKTSDVRGRFAPQPFRTAINIGIGTCIPHICSGDEVKMLANSSLMSIMNTTVADSYQPDLFCSNKKSKHTEFNALELSAIVFFSSIGLLLIASTAYEVASNPPHHPLLKCFSVYSNSKSIMRMQPQSSREMIFLHGLRALSTIWIVMVHTYLITFWNMPVLNASYFFEWLRKFSSMIILSGYMGVDTFFLLSAMLLTISVFRELDNTKRINLWVLYVKRYLRITVPLAAAIFFTVSLFYRLSDGPLWNFIVTTTTTNLCQQHWWTSLLYISNYVNPGALCFGHSWYLVVDMQLYFLSPLILYPLWRLRNRTRIVVAVIFAIASASVIYKFVMVIAYDLRVSIMAETAQLREPLVYYATHARLDSWMMGVLSGFILHNVEEKGARLSKATVIAGWSASIGVILTIIFSQYPLQQLDFGENSIFFDAIYESFKSILWCLSIMWIIIACKFNRGGIAKRFLSLSVWMPISKLSFCIYLIHLPIQVVYLSSIRVPQYFSDFRALYKFLGDFGMAFIFAFVWALSFEFPTLIVMREFIDRRRMATNINGFGAS